jgi:hypothetical protein
MNNPPEPPTNQLPSHPLLPPPRKPRFARIRAWLRSRTGRIVVPLVALVLGIAIGIGSLLFYGLSGEGQVLLVPTSGKGDLIVEADKAFLTHVVEMNLRDAGMPGNISNVEVDLANGDHMTINGDDGFSLLGIGVTKHFTIVVQPYVNNCVLQIHVVHADVSSIPVTGFVQSFESHINQQLQQKPSGLPKGFQYCTTGVRTAPAGMFVTYSAKPI